jgi:hypothetical protein
VYERIIGFTQDALNGNLQWQKFTINFFCKLIYLRTNKAVQAASVKITIDASLDVPFTIDISNYVLDYGNQLDESLISIFLFQSRRADFDYTINFSDDSYSNLVVFSVNNAESNSDGDFNDETSLINYKLYFNEESSYFRNSK